MNIFYLSHNVDECARYHVDKHVIKQIVEYAQILSTTHRVLDGKLYVDNSSGRQYKRWMLFDEKENVLYKSTHFNNPSVKWCRESQQNYYWLYNLFLRLIAEYYYRYKKVHACTKLIPYLGLAPKNINWKLFTEPTPVIGSEYIIENNSLESYRNFYKYGKQHLHSWKNRPTPTWIL